MGVDTPAENLDMMITELGDWRGEMIQRIRRLMSKIDPEMVLEWKWMGTPVWSHDGMVAIVNPHKGKVKLTFAHGAKLPDPAHLFNAGLEGNEWRAVDIFESDALNEPALGELVRTAVAFNQARVAQRAGATLPPALRRQGRAKTRESKTDSSNLRG
jgi:hypothetical protein